MCDCDESGGDASDGEHVDDAARYRTENDNAYDPKGGRGWVKSRSSAFVRRLSQANESRQAQRERAQAQADRRECRNRDAQLQTYVPEQTCRLDMFDTGRGCSLLSETTDVGRDHEDRAPVAEHSPPLHHMSYMTLYARTMCTVGPMSPRLHTGAKILAAQLLTVLDCCSNMTVDGLHTARITSVAARSYPHIIQNTSRMWPSSAL